MADKPIIFSAPMVRALLDGRKTQTRRVLKPLPRRAIFFDPQKAGVDQFQEPRYAPGDRLYVRETWSGEYEFRDMPPSKRQSVATPDGPILRESIWFWADGAPDFGDWERPRPPIHMPRWASRLTLTVTEVRVQRLQEISEADAVAEGVEDVTREVAPGEPDLRFWRRYRDGGWNGYVDTATGSYASLWTELHGPGAWEANPWVAAYSFTVQRGNIDNLLPEGGA